MVLMPLKVPEAKVSVLHAITVTTGVPVVLFSFGSGPSLTVKVVEVGVDEIVFTPVHEAKPPPVNPLRVTWAPDCELCARLEVYVATPWVGTQLSKVML